MYPAPATRHLKRRAQDSDDDTSTTKQPRINVQNTHARRLPPLRRSDSQFLDVNASRAVIQHFPTPSEPVPIEPSDQYRDGDQDMGGSTEEESQDEAGAWDRRAKAHRHVALFKRPREPAPKMKPRRVAQTISEVALLDGSDSDSDVVKLLPTNSSVNTKLQRLVALRAAAGKTTVSLKPRITLKAPVLAVAPSSMASSSTNTTTTKTTTRSVSRTASRTSVTTTTSVSQRVQEINEITSSCPTRVPRARGPKLMPAPEVAPAPKAVEARPQRQSSRTRVTAINAIASSSSNNASTGLRTRQRLATAAPLASQPSAILRRSKRIVDMHAALEMN